MASVVAGLFAKLTADPWRAATGFGQDIGEWNDRILGADTDAKVEELMNEWLQKYQPCLFGRLAAKTNAITYCVLREADLELSDEKIAGKVQERRLAWSKAAYYGRSSAFVVVVVSSRIVNAVPDSTMADLAQRLAFLYLRREIDFDTAYTDEIALEFPGEARLTRVWQTGVNYFCAQGDGRWWRDHRIPGGAAFSVNSVGHLVRTGRMNNAFELLKSDLETNPPTGFRIDSLEKALEFAMRTIYLASEGISGKATKLLPIPSQPIKCPVELPTYLRDKDFCTYWGAYDTDVTLPREYFRPDVERPGDVADHALDFTYLFHKDVDNPDYEAVGEGRRIRAALNESADNRDSSASLKRRRGVERVVEIQQTQLLREALADDVGLSD